MQTELARKYYEAQPRLPASVPTFVSNVVYYYIVLCSCMRASSLRSFVDMRVASSRREASPRPVADTPSPPRPARSSIVRLVVAP
jgi:hypothetical protein